jgi:TP901 family phage tail tape measure protein
MSNNIIKTTEIIVKASEVLTKHAQTLDKAATSLSKLNTEYKKIPSEYLKAMQDQEKLEQQRLKTQKQAIGISKSLSAQKAKETAQEKKNTNEIKSKIPTLRQLVTINKQNTVANEKLSRSYLVLVDKMNKVSKVVQDLNAKKAQGQKLSDKEQAELKQSTQQFSKYQSAVLKADASVGKFNRNVGNYPKGLRAAASAARSFASAMGLIGGAFLIVQVVRDAFNTIREFDKQIIAVQKTTNLTNTEIKLFKNEVVDLGLALKGVSIQGLLKSAEVAGQLGIKGRSNILKFSEVIEKLKLTSDIAGDESVRNFAKFIEVSTDTVKNADRLGSVITELGNNFATTESQILSNATEIQKALAIYDASAQGVLGLGAATSALGAEAEQSRSALQKTFKVLNDGAATGENLEAILKLTGQTAAEFREEFGRDSVKTFDRFIKGLSDSADSGANLSITLRDLGLDEKRTEAVIGILSKNYGVLSSALNKANTEYKENAALNREAALSAESLDAKIKDLGDSWDGFVLSLEKGDGVISRTFKSLIGFIENVLIGLNELNKTQEEFGNSLEGKAFDKQLAYYESLGESANDLAEIDKRNSADKVGWIQEEIKSLTDRNKAIRDGQLGLGEQTGNASELERNRTELEKLNITLSTAKGRLRAAQTQLGELKESVEDTTTVISDNTLETDKNTKSKEDNNKAIQDTFGFLQGTIPFYEEIINGLVEQQTQLSRNTQEWYAYQQQIDSFTESLTQLKRELTGDYSASEGTDAAVNKINDLVEKFNPADGSIDPPDDTTDKWKDTFQNITNVARQAFGVITALSDASFAKQFSNLEAQKENALLFAGDSATARLNIEEQYDQRRKVIEERQAKAKKRQALFEIVINTASAVVQALPSVPLAIAVGALGAVQLALVASQQIPQFWQGGEVGSSQQIMVNDDPYGKKGANYKEVIEKPNGQILKPQGKNVKMTVPKGTHVHPTHDAYNSFVSSLDSELLNNNIMPIGQSNIAPMVINNGLSKSDLIDGLSQHGKSLVHAINNKESFTFSYDEKGIEVRRKKQGVKSKVMNARYTGKGLGV